ncbi:hypothetical protein BTR14_03075 [Rhizobium rhizosphaerae]|uniref:Uncharacterized protein n=1 Tax=Xaviernesmea rhizosphaerae TaxID=1672749 RepID=A0ABX3PGQ5_9HYPH|nr:hypothetical protein [Xaviernesmea rhizosphaerae]OQP87567.1 hypothetical protein BTR14_03075 [Xaviernesmea rhizosphaerae]
MIMETSWSLAQALAWIIEQKHGVRLEADNNTAIAIMLLDVEDVLPPGAADKSLLELIWHLEKGKFPASAVREDNRETVTIPPNYWPQLKITPMFHGESPRGDRLDVPVEQGSKILAPAYGSVRLMPCDVMQCWPENGYDVQATSGRGMEVCTPFHGQDELPPAVVRVFETLVDAAPPASPAPANGDRIGKVDRKELRAQLKKANRFAIDNGLKPWTKGEAETQLPDIFPGRYSRDRIRSELKHDDVARLFQSGPGRPRNSKTNINRNNELELIRAVFSSAN